MASGDVTPKLLASPTLVNTTSTTLFTVPSAHQYAIKQIVICNTDTIDRLVTVAKGTTATAGNCFVYRLAIAASDTVVLDTALVLEATEFIAGSSDTGGFVTITVTGWDREL